MNVTEFLLKRIAEDEAEARRLAERYDETDNMNWYGNSDDVEVHLGVGRALAECEAKRRIIADHIRPSSWCDYEHAGPDRDLCVTLRALASVYADHPDYRQDWA